MLTSTLHTVNQNPKNIYVEWFKSLQLHICTRLEEIESEFESAEEPQKFVRKSWKRDDETQPNRDGGGGTMAVMQGGRVFEKAGVNFSEVYGEFSKKFAAEIPGADTDPSFWASGISLVIHPLNPFVPIVHMNTRHIMTQKSWFGGGADLTPCIPFDEDTKSFHQGMQDACDAYHPEAHAKYKKWCDEYFYLPHRNEMRGVGGIFFDYVNSGDENADFAFLKQVGINFIDSYVAIVRKRMNTPWTEKDKEIQLHKRGRYVEFNLLHDRGTKFGLMTNGNTEAILMSLPPLASWKV
jgi:coproporphyrinogen III oxidase